VSSILSLDVRDAICGRARSGKRPEVVEDVFEGRATGASVRTVTRAADESDPDRLLELVREITFFLEEKRQDLKPSAQLPSSDKPIEQLEVGRHAARELPTASFPRL